jgi:hypothetical protein
VAVAAPPAPATVLRLRIDGEGSWVRALPPAPPGHLLTLSADSPDAAALLVAAADDLSGRGYRYIGEVPAPSPGAGPPTAHLVVPGLVVEADPAWWRSLVGGADQVLPMLFGPVERRFRALVAAHDVVRRPRG